MDDKKATNDADPSTVADETTPSAPELQQQQRHQSSSGPADIDTTQNKEEMDVDKDYDSNKIDASTQQSENSGIPKSSENVVPMQVEFGTTGASHRAPSTQLQEAFEAYRGDVKKPKKKKNRKLKIFLSQTAIDSQPDSAASNEVPTTKHAESNEYESMPFPALINHFAVSLEDPFALPTSPARSDTHKDELQSWSNGLEAELEQSLAFYEETHEEQTPAFQAYMKKRREEELRKELAKLDQQDRQGRAEIERIMMEQMKEKQVSTERSVEKYKLRVVQDEKRETQKLNLAYHQRTNSTQQRMSQAIKLLQRRHQDEMQQTMRRHQQTVQQHCLPEQMASAEWQNTVRQLQAKQQRQMQEMSAKGEEMRKKLESDYKREQEKIRKTSEQKLNDAESSRQKLASKLYSHFQQLRQRYLKRHLQKIIRQREELKKPDISEETLGADDGNGDNKTYTPKEVAKTTMEEKAELNPPSPIKSMQPWAEESSYPPAGAAGRHKNRKGVMSQSRRQLSVEIHNEGIWVAVDKGSTSVEDESRLISSSSKEEQEFIPWGVKAQSFLEAIICGDIPSMYDASKFGDAAALQGGQVRCVISDLRTSEETASIHRANSIREQAESNLEHLEKKVTELSVLARDAEKAANKALNEEKECLAAAETTTKEVAKARRQEEEFRQKFRDYLGPDGTPSPATNPNDRQELIKAMMQYKSNLETQMRREQAVKQKLTETKAQAQKLTAQAKNALKNASIAANALKKKREQILSSIQAPAEVRPTKQSEAADAEKASVRVRDVVSALRKTAGKRREQSIQKQSNSFSSAWIQSFSNLPNSLKKSLWHKMHRRKQQIILRPSEESLVNGLRAMVTQTVTVNQNRSPQKKISLEAELVKAEQLFLLATHPLAEEDLPTSPSSKSSDPWAEPGWRLILDVPHEEYKQGCILPCASSFPVLETNASEISSAPGRQASSLLRTSHLRCMTAPLSTFAIASSPAEPNASLSLNCSYAEGDPLHTTKDAMDLGYTFSVKSAPTKPAQASRKRSSSSKERTATTEPKGKKSATSETKAQTERRSSETKKRRGSKGPGPSPRTQKRKVDHPAPTNSQNAPPPQLAVANAQRRGSGASSSTGGNVPYSSQYRPPVQQNQPLGQNSQRPQSQQSTNPSSQQQQQQHQQHPPPYSSHQMAQLRMMQQQQQQAAQSSPNRSVNTTAGFPPHMQQFFAPSPLNHPGASGHGMPHMAPRGPSGMYPQQMIPGIPQSPSAARGSIPSQPQHLHQQQQYLQSQSQQQTQHQQRQQQQQPRKQQNNDSNDPLFMLK